MNSKIRNFLLALVALALLTGCGVSAAGDEVAVQFGGGLAEDAKAKGCKPQGTNEVFGALGDDYLKIPAGQRTYKAKNGPDGNPEPTAEQGAMTFTIKGVEMSTEVQVEYVVNLDCVRVGDNLSPLETFATDFGLKYKSLHGDNWFLELLRDYIGRQTDQALDDAAAELVTADNTIDWRRLYSDQEAKGNLEEAAGRKAVTLVERAMGGRRFCGPGATTKEEDGKASCNPFIFTITPPRPTDPAYIDLIRDEEVAAGQVKIADQQKLANDAKIAADEKLLLTYGVEGLLEQRRLDLMQQAIEKGSITILPVPQGSNVTIPAPAPR